MKKQLTSIALFAACFTATLPARAAVVTLSPGIDGGVVLVADGEAGFGQLFSNQLSLVIAGSEVVGPDNSTFNSTSAGGTLVVTSPYTVTSVQIDTNFGQDFINFNLSDYANGGAIDFQNVTANWTVDVLSFDSLTPGTYGTNYTDTTLVILPIPEPASARCWRSAGWR